MTTPATVVGRDHLRRLCVLVVAHLDQEVLHVEDLFRALGYARTVTSNVAVLSFEVLALTFTVSVPLDLVSD